MKLSLFFTLPDRDASDLSLFWLLTVSGRGALDWRGRLLSLMFDRPLLGKLGNASGCGELGVELRKFKLSRWRLDGSLLRLPDETVVEASSSIVGFSTLRSLSLSFSFSFSFSLSFSDSPKRKSLVKKARLCLFLSCREDRPFCTGGATLSPLAVFSSGAGLATRERDVAAASHEPVGDRVAGAMFVGNRADSSRE